MTPPPRTWPDGRPVGGEHGYPPEYHAWTLECQARYVARLLLKVRKMSDRQAEIAFWQKKLPGLDPQRVGQLWLEYRRANARR